GTVCVVGKIRDLILQLSKSSIYSTKPFSCSRRVGVPISSNHFSSAAMPSWQLKNGLNLNGLNLLAVNPDFRTLPHFRVIILNVFNKRCY
ncbi:hypothetical protein ELE42_15225, partial [Klebsiella pneumoniae]|nr:hypothetical protein [Klebsiella pneumoniae]